MAERIIFEGDELMEDRSSGRVLLTEERHNNRQHDPSLA